MHLVEYMDKLNLQVDSQLLEDLKNLTRFKYLDRIHSGDT